MRSAASGAWRKASGELHAMPLRLRLTALLLALMALAMLITGLAASSELRAFLLQRQDAELLAAKTQLVAAAMTEQSTNNTESPVPAYVPTNTYAVHLHWRGGDSQSFLDEHSVTPAWPTLSPTNKHVRNGKPFTIGSVNSDTTWRVVAGVTPDGKGTYAVAVSMARVDDIITRLIVVIGTAEGTLLVLCGVIGWFLVRRAMRPLREIQNTAATIADGDLTQRITVRGTHDEVGSLSKSLNVMLSRIEDSFAVRRASEERMRRFVADASHELRTPLATVRGYAELFRQGAVTGQDAVSSAMRRIEDESIRMGVMVDDLLLLTRLEHRTLNPSARTRPFAPVDLTVLGADAVQDAIALDHSRSIHLVGRDGPVTASMVAGDESALRQVLTNLMANAIRYTPPLSPIEVVVGSSGGRAYLAVRDHGEGIPADLRSRIFERFFRADASRNSAKGGSGLGLAIVAAIVTEHHGTVRVEDTDGGGATFVLDLPALDTETTQSSHRIAKEEGQGHGVE